MDVTDATFEADVLGRSAEVPVVVDLWAEWCGPCKTLGPILEKVIAGTDGRVELAKVDVDNNPRVAATFQVQSIPAVYAIHQRKVVDNFVGALPESQVRAWVAKIAPEPTAVDQLIAAGDEQSLRQAVAMEPGNEPAILALARILVDADTASSQSEALALLQRIPDSAEARHLAAQARVGDEVADASGNGEDITGKLDALLERVKSDEEARQEFVDLLEVLGPEDPRTSTYRKALTARLF